MDNFKIRRLEWAGLILRMEDERIPRKVLNGKFHNTRPVGKPRTRWEVFVWRNTSYPSSKRMEDTSRRQRRKEASSEGGQESGYEWEYRRCSVIGCYIC